MTLTLTPVRVLFRSTRLRTSTSSNSSTDSISSTRSSSSPSGSPRVVHVRMKEIHGSIDLEIGNDVKQLKDLLLRFHHAAFSKSYAAYVDQCCLLRIQENLCTGERHEVIVKSLQDLQDQDILVYKPCEELRRMLEQGCITPMLSRKSVRSSSSSSSTSSTSSPSLKRKGRCPSIASMSEQVNRFAPMLEKIDVSPREKALIHDLLSTGDELVVDALEQFSISRNYAGLRRVLHGPVKKELVYSPPPLPQEPSLDYLSANFASLDVDTTAAVATPQQLEEEDPFLMMMGESSNQMEEESGVSGVEDPIPLSLDGSLLQSMMMDPMLMMRLSAPTPAHMIPSPPTSSPGGVQRPSLMLDNHNLGGVGVDQGVCIMAPSSGGIFLPSIQEKIFSSPSRMEMNDLSSCATPICASSTFSSHGEGFMIASLLENIPVKIYEDFYMKYSIGEILGSGKCSIVKEAIDKQNPKNKLAVKIIQKRHVLTSENVRFLKRELEILSSLKHEGIVQLIAVYETVEELFLVMELCQQDLFQKIDENGPLEEKIAKKLIKKLVQTVKYLHQNAIVHRDIKPENVLIFDKEDVANVKLADFGIARRLEAGSNQLILPTTINTSSTSCNTSQPPSSSGSSTSSSDGPVRNRTARAHTRCGTRDYIAPEVMSTKGYGIEADMWSIGVVTFVLISGCAPVFLPSNDGSEGLAVYFGGGPDDVWPTVSEELKDFISKLLVRNPEERMMASKALKHPWLL